MSNYPAGAEYDSNAPFNKKELQGETIGLFEYLENLEMPYEVRLKLKEFEYNRQLAFKELSNLAYDFAKEDRPMASQLVYFMQKLISEPQIFIENNTNK